MILSLFRCTVAILAGVMILGSCSVSKFNTNSFSSDNGDGTYTNPLIKADYPDPDIIRVGDDYYMVSSSFVAMPGIPISHSKDLVNWEVIGHVYDSITFQPQYRMENEQTAYSRICWAPSIKYYQGTYYVGVNIADDGFVMFKSKHIEGPYEMFKFDSRLYDPGIFIDDDGKKYVTHGKGKIYLSRLNDEGTGLMDPKDPGKLIITAPKEYGHLFEGCHTYKRNGWYYIFNPALGYDGVQMISRSKNLYGPYETKVLIDDDINYPGAGVHQGGYVQTAQGESWAFTFQDRDYLGRDLMLYPMKWENDWPVVGVEGAPGKGVVTYKKPAIKGRFKLKFPQHSDEFNNNELSEVWEFNHVPVKDKWSLNERRGFFRLYSQPARGFYWAKNSLTQKVSGPSSTGTVLLDISGLKEGDFAGTGIMGSNMFQLGVYKQNNLLQVKLRKVNKNMDTEITLDSAKIHLDKIWLRSEITKHGTLKFYYSLDAKRYNPLGEELESNFWGFLGIRHTLFNYNLLGKAQSGFADFDKFILDGDVRGNHYDGLTELDFSQYDQRSGMDMVRELPKRPVSYFKNMKEADYLTFNNIEFKQRPNYIELKTRGNLNEAIIEVRKGSVDGALIANCLIQGSRTEDPSQWQVQRFEVGKLNKREKIYFIIKKPSEGLELKSFRFMLKN